MSEFKLTLFIALDVGATEIEADVVPNTRHFPRVMIAGADALLTAIADAQTCSCGNCTRFRRAALRALEALGEVTELVTH